MVQLIATSQDGSDQVQLDTPKVPIQLNFHFQDLANPFANRTPYSFNFKLPATRENLKFFSYYYDYNVSLGTFKATKRTNVDVYDNGILVMSGIMQLLSATEDEYTVVVFEELAKLFETIKDLSWEQLFITEAGTVDTDLDHSLTWTNIIDSWTLTNDVTSGNVGNGVIVYPLADYGLNATNNANNEGTSTGFTYNGPGTGMDNNSNYTQSLAAKNFKPAIRIQYLIKYIFEYAGFVYNSTFFDSADFQKIYMFLATETERVKSRATYGFRTGLTTAYDIPIAQAGIWQSLVFDYETGSPYYDPDGLVTNGVFTAPYDGSYLLATRLFVRTIATTSSTDFTVRVRMQVNGGNATSYPIYCDPTVVNTVDHQYWLDLNAGDVVSVSALSNNSFDTVQITSDVTNGQSFFNLINFSGSVGFVDVSANFPNDVTVDKWLKAIFEKFNLRMVTDRDSVGTIYVEPWNDWWDSGEKKDWTNKVDADSVTIEPTTKYQKKSITFADGEGDDFLNQWYQHHNQRVKGTYIFENEDNDFSTGEMETSDIFQPLRNRKIYTWIQNTGTSQVPNVLCPAFWVWSDGSNGSIYIKESVACKPVLAYYNGLQNIGNGATFNYGGTAGTTFPYFAEYNTYGVTTATQSLRWGYSYPDNLEMPAVGGYTNKYLFTTYWLRMMNEIYSDQSRLMTANFSLNATDIYDLKFNDFLYIEGAYWKLLSLKNFTLDGEKLCNAELIKVIDAPAARIDGNCALQVDSFNDDGTVNFIDAKTGVSAPATAECCTINGYVWSESAQECFISPGNENGGGGTNPIGTYPEPISGFVNAQTGLGIGTNVPVQAFNSTQISGGTYSLELFAQTTSASAVAAASNQGLSLFNVGDDSITYITYDITTIEVGGGNGTLGNTANFTARTAIANTRSSAAVGCTLRTIGNPTIINSESDGGTHSTINIGINQRSAGATATYSLQCTGQANVIEQWFIRATVQVVQINDAEVVLETPAYFNLSSNTAITLNVSPTQTLAFNGAGSAPSPPPTFTGLLNESYGSGAEAAYSTRRLNGNITECMVIRRASDSTTQTIGFDGSGNINEADIISFCTGTTCTVSEWKDQSGNGNDATAPSTGEEPTIYTGGALVKESGKVAIDFDGSNDNFDNSTLTLTSNDTLISVVSKVETTSTAVNIFDSSESNKFFLQIDASKSFQFNNGSGTNLNHKNDGFRYLTSLDFNGATLKSYFNGYNTKTATVSNQSRSGLRIGKHRESGTGWIDGTMQELIYWNQNKNANHTSIESNVGDYFTQNTPLLDTYSGAAACYSLRLMRTAYTGSAIRVRRSSDNTEQDIGFNVFGELDTVSLLDFAGTGDAFVKVWYDQASTNDATQTTTASQPQIVSSGAVIVENGKPSIYFVNNTKQLAKTSGWGGTNVNTCDIVNVHRRASGSGNPLFWYQSSFQVANYGTPSYGLGWGNPTTGPAADTNQNIFYGKASNAVGQIFLNNVASTAGTLNAARYFSGSFAFQGRPGFPGAYAAPEIYQQEFIQWDLNQSDSDRSGITANMATFYGITI